MPNVALAQLLVKGLHDSPGTACGGIEELCRVYPWE